MQTLPTRTTTTKQRRRSVWVPLRDEASGRPATAVAPVRPDGEIAPLDVREEVWLIACSDRALRRVVSGLTAAEGAAARVAPSLIDAIKLVASRPVDGIVVQDGLSGVAAIDACRSLRAWTEAPLIVLLADGSATHRIAVLDAGADAALGNPLDIHELAATVRAGRRRFARRPSTHATAVTFGANEVDIDGRLVTRAGTPVHLSPHELGVLLVLAIHHDRVVPHAELLQRVWGPQYGCENNYLWVVMRHLRLKLEADPSNPKHLLTVPGVGYRLQTAAAD